MSVIDRFPMTAKGYEAMQTELRFLKAEERPAITRAIAEAREHGDLKENAEYHAARERQSFCEGRIQELEAKISRAEVIEPAKMAGSATIKFGATVTVIDADDEEEKEITYQLVGQEEANIEKGLISITSPLGRALIGKQEGDVAEVNAPGGGKSYEVIKLEYI